VREGNWRRGREGRGGEKRVEGVRPYGGIEMCIIIIFISSIYPQGSKDPGG